ncbi:hypothetical protein [Variovorax sp. PAMC26660]|uniref:hypothetical protein n=1 Tax=Variovorax sp. PAMC26660 TaxID=2762322 RepID=UPI00164DDB6E|nr:hypothetical protein [Variovorax sp. PAMC26660]QNK67636.1 hypothetical protein H7F35_31615 [Variovorax sp. PAMC26660]
MQGGYATFGITQPARKFLNNAENNSQGCGARLFGRFKKTYDRGRADFLERKPSAAEKAQAQAELQQRRVRELRDEQNIWVLAVYLNRQLWTHFYYPTEELRRDAATGWWVEHFDLLGLRSEYDFKYLDPRD